MNKYQEMRTILSGRVVFVNGAYSAATSLWKAGFVGMFSGSDTAGILGIRMAVRHYQSDSIDAGIFTAKNIFNKLGRPIRFQSDPMLPACFLRNYIGNPVILLLGEDDAGIRIEAYTARTILAGMNLRKAFRMFENQLPEDMLTIISSDGEKAKNVKTKESRKERRARQKAEKLEKRAERINTRAQAAAQAAKKNKEPNAETDE